MRESCFETVYICILYIFVYIHSVLSKLEQTAPSSRLLIFRKLFSLQWNVGESSLRHNAQSWNLTLPPPNGSADENEFISFNLPSVFFSLYHLNMKNITLPRNVALPHASSLQDGRRLERDGPSRASRRNGAFFASEARGGGLYTKTWRLRDLSGPTLGSGGAIVEWRLDRHRPQTVSKRLRWDQYQ